VTMYIMYGPGVMGHIVTIMDHMRQVPFLVPITLGLKKGHTKSGS